MFVYGTCFYVCSSDCVVVCGNVCCVAGVLALGQLLNYMILIEIYLCAKQSIDLLGG